MTQKIVKTCDMCGITTEETINRFYVLRFDYSKKEKDLCSECTKKVLNFIEHDIKAISKV